MLEQKLEQDIKTALLGGDAARVSTLRLLKSVLLNEKVAKGKRDSGLTDDEVIAVLAKEAKKRQESADLYSQAGDQTRTAAELAEKAIIEEYLPEQVSEEELAAMVDAVIQETGAAGPQAMGQVIGAVKAKAGAGADGALIAKLAKEKLNA
ncbi:MAG TPA: GatB/YqeY domain-containing protein [Candidatus Saccharimonadales bacterium]|nr:GatB/YqeY domain-containing protein [Candidatus Saccharimonadales bacterium]